MIFLDTGYFLALFNPRDKLHQRAVNWSVQTKEQLLVSEYVLWECVNAFSGLTERNAAHAIVQYVRAEGGSELISASEALFQAGLELHRQRPDKEWSLTDCISFHIMEDRKIQKAFAYDQHFEQAGFTALLRQDPPET